MRAIQYSHYYKDSPSEVLEHVTLPVPEIASNEILIKVHATSLNAVDWKMAKGYLSMVSSLPIVPCFDVAGVIVEIGDKVKRTYSDDTEMSVGDRVYGYARAVYSKRVCGCAAEFVVLTRSSVCKMPRNLDFVEAAGFPLVGVTAYQSIYKWLGEGVKCLVLGGSGGAGSMGVQLAKACGAYVATTCSQRNIEFMESLGVDRIVNYTEENWYEVLQDDEGWDIVYDCIGDSPHNYEYSKQILKPGGRFVTITGDVQDQISFTRIASIGWALLSRKLGSVFSGNPKYYYVTADASKTYYQLPVITQLIEEGLIVPVIDRIYPLDEFNEAMEYMASGSAQGKVIISVAGEDEGNPESPDEFEVEIVYEDTDKNETEPLPSEDRQNDKPEDITDDENVDIQTVTVNQEDQITRDETEDKAPETDQSTPIETPEDMNTSQ